jgi:hypothetical protein
VASDSNCLCSVSRAARHFTLFLRTKFLERILSDCFQLFLNQALAFSCLVACARQLLRDAGVELSEGELIERIGVIDGFGSTVEPTAAALTDPHRRLK